MDAKFNLHGAKELDDLLKLLPEEMARKVAENAVRTGANFLKKKVEEKAPGRIKEAIIVRKDKNGTSSVNYQIATSKDAPHAHLVEFGTAPHEEKAGQRRGHPTGKKVLSNGTKLFGSKIKHPGTKAEPFFRPALDEGQAEYLKKMATILARGLARAAAKFTRR